MAYTLEQSTTGVQGVADELIYVVKDDTNTGELNYRYICIISDGATELLRLKQLPNNALAAVFNIQSIVSNYVEQDESPYRLGLNDLDGDPSTTTIFATNTDALKTITVGFGYEFSVAAGDVPTVTLVPALDTDVICVNGNFLRSTEVAPNVNAASDYKLASASRLFLSDVYNTNLEQDVLYGSATQTQWMAFAFLNGDDVGSTGSGYLHFSYFNGATALNTGYIQNYPTTGGVVPTTGLIDAQSLLYVGVGTANLNNQAINTNLQPSDSGNVGWTHYLVQWSSAITLSGNETSTSYKFNRVTCGKYITNEQMFSLHWWNSKGGVDNLLVTGKVMESQEMDKKDYRTSGGNSFSANGSGTEYKRQPWQGGKKSTNVLTTTSLQLTTQGGTPDNLTPLIKSLLNSERVYLSGKSFWGNNSDVATSGIVQAYIKDKNLEVLTNINEGAISYKIGVEISRRRANV
tara:strand:- start:1482 stop:2867 length:1386 start_codon:yes stop_codon:yes gene_type:complete